LPFQVQTCEKETNTDTLSENCRLKPGYCSGSGSFSKDDTLTPLFSRKLNRSDSDTSVAIIQKREPFQRNGAERRSLRYNGWMEV